MKSFFGQKHFVDLRGLCLDFKKVLYLSLPQILDKVKKEHVNWTLAHTL